MEESTRRCSVQWGGPENKESVELPVRVGWDSFADVFPGRRKGKSPRYRRRMLLCVAKGLLLCIGSGESALDARRFKCDPRA